jgi:3-oxoacyl-[acyl-carrier protein] reductase
VVSDAERLRRTVARIPVGRLGSPEDVATAVVYLVSPGSAFVNGAVITVDGGETAGVPLMRPEEWS